MENSNENNTIWTREWPTTPGYYWFYGWCFSRHRDDPPRLNFVHVRNGAGRSIFYVTNGHFLYKSEAEKEGWWAEAKLPNLPELALKEEQSGKT